VEVIARLLKRPPAMLEDWLFTKKDFCRVLDGKPDLKVIQESIEKVKELGFIKETVDVSKYADLSFIEEATRRRRNGN
jgi:NitT/TauT family transport system substrate-binding protein